ncbi:DUF6476 family protein [Roseomonas sp. CCTCC AB2023176]|uniref:DUF6476 family protein n=1 Tax=Roseomonas sp. CCTCC AB2023176 TaxID=3342640 RepID=UPI0035D9B297
MRALKVLVVVMGVLIVAGTVTLGVLIVQRMGAAAPTTAPVSVGLGQPPGTRILGVAPGAEGRIVIALSRPDGDRLLILDPRSGRMLGEIRAGE